MWRYFEDIELKAGRARMVAGLNSSLWEGSQCANLSFPSESISKSFDIQLIPFLHICTMNESISGYKLADFHALF